MISDHFAWPSEVWSGNQKRRKTLNSNNNRVPWPFGSWAFMWLCDTYIYPRMPIRRRPHGEQALLHSRTQITLPAARQMGCTGDGTPATPWGDTLQTCVSRHFSDGWTCGSRKCNYTQQRAGWRLFGCRSLATWIWFGHGCYSWCRCGRLLWSGSLCSHVLRN